MNIHLFFKGKLAREEASSALLATLLEQRADFRRSFFNACGTVDLQRDSEGHWEVATEESDFDILLQSDSSNWVVLVENKIQSGSVTPEQLSRYYRRLRDTSPKSILFVYLTPKPGTGQAEFRRLTRDLTAHKDDRFVHLSWDDVFDYETQSGTPDEHTNFIRSGFAAIRSHIENSMQEKYSLVGGREILDRIGGRLHSDLRQAFPHIDFRRWRGADASTTYTAKADLSVYFKAVTAYDEHTYEPVGLLNDDFTLNVTLEVSMGISGSGRRKRSVLQHWTALTEGGSIAVPTLGIMTTGDASKRWFVWSKAVTATDEEVHRQLLDASKAVLRHMEPFFPVNEAVTAPVQE